MDEQATTKAHRFLKFGRKADKESQKAGGQQREATSLIPKFGHNIDGQSTKNKKLLADHTVKASQQLTSTDHGPAHIQATQKLTFWERAYSEIINDKDEDIQELLEAYGILLRDNSNEEQELENEAAQTQAKSADSDLSANYDKPLPESSSKVDEDIMARHHVGDEAHMRKFATVRLGEMQSKEWKLKWRGKEIFNIRKQVSTIVQIVEKFSGFLGSVAAMDTSQHAGLAWAGVCVLLPLITNDTKERQIAIDGIEVMTRITARYTTVDRDYTSGRMYHDPSFEKALVRLYLKIALFYMKASCYFARSTLTRTVRGTFAADAWTSAQSAVEQADQDCQKFAVSLGLSTILARTDKILDSLREIQLEDHIDRVKKWLLHDVDVEYQHASTREKLGAQYRESGKWLLDSPEFQGWIQGSHGQFWIQGVIGTGKTSLVSIIIDHVKQKFENLAFFYFSGNFEDSAPGINMHLTKVMGALIGQLALSPNGDRVAEEVDLYFTKAVEKGTLRSPVPLDFEQASKLLIEVINSRDETIVILDGLDEFPSFASLLHNLRTIDCDAKNLKILFSSQYVVPIDRFFPSAVSAVAGGKDSFPDMRMFVEGELRRFQVQRPNLIDEALAADIIETLPEKAEGTFKWAELSLKAVLDPDSEIDVKEINANWQSIKSTQFQWITRDFIQIYEVLYEKSLPSKHQAGPSSSEQKAERALFWVLGAVRPLARDEYFMVQGNITESVAEVSEVQISKICRNFLFLSDEGTVTLSHSSVRDYLTLKLSRQVKRFLHIDKGSKNVANTDDDVLKIARETSLQLANSRICTDCLDIIMDSKNWTKEGSKGNPLLSYACKFWPKHASLCNEKYFQGEILDRIKSLFHVKNYDTFRRWVPVFDDAKSEQSSKEPDPLYYAVILEMPDIVQFCLDQGSSATSKGGEHGFPLQTACYLGNMTIFSLMISGADINNVDNVYGTPLQASIAGKHKDVAMNLISKYGADVNLQGGPFGTAQQIAFALMDVDLLACLNAHGSKMDDGSERDQAWATAWEWNYAKIQEFSLAVINRLRNLLRMGPSLLPRSVDSCLQLLAICIHTRSVALASSSYQDFMLRAFESHDASQRPKVKEYYARIGMHAACLEDCYERMRKDDLDCRSFIPATLSGLLLFDISVDGDVHSIELVDYLATSITRHDLFLRLYPGHGKHSAIGRMVAEYFSQLLSHLLPLPLSGSRSRMMRYIYKEMFMEGRKEKIIAFLSQLNARTIELEDIYDAWKESDDNKAWQKDISSSMDDMKGEIKEMRETILDLKRLIETLIVTNERNLNTSPMV